MSTEQSSNQPAFDFVPVQEETCKQIFSDGAHGILVSPANSKITFYEMVGIDAQSGKERRKPTLTVVIPTYALVELCKNFSNQLEKNRQMLSEGFDRQRNIIFPSVEE